MKATFCFSSGAGRITFAPALVLFVWLGLIAISGICLRGQTFPQVAPGVFKVGALQHPAILESSALAASPAHPGVYWTHNDSESPAFLFALDATGKHIGAYEVRGAALIDWEATTVSGGFLFFADTGTNGMERTHSAIHKASEPDLQKPWGTVQVLQTWYVRFPGQREDCESLFIFGDNAYLLGKYPSGGTVPLYWFRLSDGSESILLRKVADVPATSPVSDAAISPDRNRMAIVSEDGVTVFFIGGNPETAGSALRRTIRYRNDSIEGSVFTMGGVLTSGEVKPDLLLFNDALLEGAPVFTTNLEDVSGFTGETARLSGLAAGFPAPVYEWRFNGDLLPGRTNAFLELTNLTLDASGVYELRASNPAGSVVSRATLTVVEKVFDLRITEVMSSENPNTLRTADWWELTNFDTNIVDLSGWRFNDSLGGLGDAYTLPPGISIRPGESIVFVEDLTREEFLAWWGETNFSPDVQVISYSGSALSFRASGDSLRLWDAKVDEDGKIAARVDFGEADQGVTFGYDPETGQFGVKSQVNVNGGFTAERGGDVGSPGRVGQTSLRIVFKAPAGEAIFEMSLPAPLESSVLEHSIDLREWSESSGADPATNGIVEINPGEQARFFRIRRE